MSYSDNLPRKIKTDSRCFALLEDGRLCGKFAKYEITLHKDTSMDINCPLKWARIFVCEKHLPDYEKSQIKPALSKVEG